MGQHHVNSPILNWTTTPPNTQNEASLIHPVAVVEIYQNGYDWYILYSDGWIEQGGYQSVESISAYGAATPTSFIEEFDQIPVMIKCTPVYTGTTSTTNNDYALHGISNVSSTGFTYRKCSGGSNNLTGFYWTAKGIKKQS